MLGTDLAGLCNVWTLINTARSFFEIRNKLWKELDAARHSTPLPRQQHSHRFVSAAPLPRHFPAVPRQCAAVARHARHFHPARSNAVLTAPIRLAKLPVTLEGIQQAASLASAGLPTASGSNVRLDSLESVFEVPRSGTMRQHGQPKTWKRKLDDTTMDAESPSTRKRRKL
jgi:hypothetical protein